MKTYEDNKIRSKKSEIDQPENDARKVDEEVYNYMVWLRMQQKNLIIKLVTLRNKNVRNL